MPDSASTATALFSGVKVMHRTVGVSNTKQGDCEGSLKPENRLKNVMYWAQDAKKFTGIYNFFYNFIFTIT